MAALSLDAFIFHVLQTRHHFMKSAIGFGIGTVFMGILTFVYAVFGINQETGILLVLINQLICINSVRTCFLIAVADLLFLLLDFLFTWTISLSKERNNVPFGLFRVSVYMTYAIYFFILFVDLNIPLLSVILQMLLVFAVIFDMVALMILLSSQTTASVRVKLIICNVSALLLSAFLFYEFGRDGDHISEFFQLGQVNTAFILQLLCNFLMMLLILQCFIYMLISIFTPKTSILHCFSPVLYASIGLLLSGGFYYKGNLTNFYLPETMFIYYIVMICFAVGIAVSFLSAAYKLIFTKTKTKETERIYIDQD
ncbi:MAG: hypothetical protein K5695_05245 [Oscillospiraceae bacterium]|nr:hypothetical protein [Oscillospiraceae bacterium]